MITGIVKKFGLVAMIALAFMINVPEVFAAHRGSYRERRRYEHIRHGHDRFDYYEGRYYRTSLFGALLSVVFPPVGVTVTYLPRGHRTIYVGGVTCYEYDDVYYRPCPAGYVVVERPV
jgi:hypothetical protein